MFIFDNQIIKLFKNIITVGNDEKPMPRSH